MPRTPAKSHDEVSPPQATTATDTANTATATPTAKVGTTEATGETAMPPDPTMQQAKRDLDAGMVDTDMRATPGLDAQRRSTLVRGPGGQAPSLASGLAQQPAAAQPLAVPRKRRGLQPDLG